MGQNNILRFCQNNIVTNLLTQEEYLADSQRLIGNQPGVARSQLVNKVLRQASLVSASLGSFIAANQVADVVDTLTPEALASMFTDALLAKFTEFLNAADITASGSMMWWPTNTPPTGWLKRNGAAISRSTYADLYAVIGTTFGAGDGSTTFNLPDDRAIFIRGWDDSRGVDTGRVFGSTQSSQNLSHTHTGTTAGGGLHAHGGSTTVAGEHNHAPATGLFSVTGSGFAYGGGGGSLSTTNLTNLGGAHSHTITTDTIANHTHTFTTDGSGGAEARPFNRAYLPIIKY